MLLSAALSLTALTAISAGPDAYQAEAELHFASSQCATAVSQGAPDTALWAPYNRGQSEVLDRFAGRVEDDFANHPLFFAEASAFEATRNNRRILMRIDSMKSRSSGEELLSQCNVYDPAAPQLDWARVIQQWAGRSADGGNREISTGPVGTAQADAPARPASATRLLWEPGLIDGSSETIVSYWQGEEPTSIGTYPGLTFSVSYSELF